MSKAPFSLAKALLKSQPHRLLGIEEGRFRDGTRYTRYIFMDSNREPGMADVQAARDRYALRARFAEDMKAATGFERKSKSPCRIKP